MKHQIKYQITTIPNKLRFELKLIIDDTRDRSEYASVINADKYLTVSLYPILTLSIIRQAEIDETGNRVRAPFNINDSLAMTKYNYPIFVNELSTIQESFKTPELYSYTDKRLEINDELASKVRRVFMIGNNVVEMIPVVIAQPDETRVEGLKVKFNNEQSSVLLTINDIESLVFTMNHVTIDMIAMTIYNTYIKTGDKNQSSSTFDSSINKPSVDILPKDDTI